MQVIFRAIPSWKCVCREMTAAGHRLASGFQLTLLLSLCLWLLHGTSEAEETAPVLESLQRHSRQIPFVDIQPYYYHPVRRGPIVPPGYPRPRPHPHPHPHMANPRHIAYPRHLPIWEKMRRRIVGNDPRQTFHKISETLGALNVVGHYIFNSSSSQVDTRRDVEDVKDSGLSPLHAGAASPQVPPPQRQNFQDALYVLGKNLLGPNVTDSLVPVVRGVNKLGQLLPPVEIRDGRIVLGEFPEKEDGSPRLCTTPSGHKGRCQDLSDCSALLLDLNNLRKSICFKSLWLPGVCCPESQDSNGQPSKLVTTSTTTTTTTSTTTPRTTTTRRPTRPQTTKASKPILFETTAATTRRPTTPTTTTTKRPQGKEELNYLLDVPGGCGQAEAPSFRIIGGELTSPGQWPWMAAIFLHGPNGVEFWCGGTVINSRYVLSASHCTRDNKQRVFSSRQFTVRLGDVDLLTGDEPSDPQTFHVDKIITHPDFNGRGFYNDIALFKLSRPVSFSRFIRPVCLPPKSLQTAPFVGETPTVIGWGTSYYGGRESAILQQVELPVWRNQDCDRSYSQPITRIFLCAGFVDGGKDACQGDSGGPLMLSKDGRWMQIGIVSFGNKCAVPGYPGVYTRITEFLDWIQQNAL